MSPKYPTLNDREARERRERRRDRREERRQERMLVAFERAANGLELYATSCAKLLGTATTLTTILLHREQRREAKDAKRRECFSGRQPSCEEKPRKHGKKPNDGINADYEVKS